MNIKDIIRKSNKNETKTEETTNEKTFDEKYYEGNDKLEELIHKKLDKLLDDENEDSFEDYKKLEALFRIRNEKQKVENDAYFKGVETDSKTNSHKRLSVDNLVSCGTVVLTILGSILIENKIGMIIPRSASSITNKIRFKTA